MFSIRTKIFFQIMGAVVRDIASSSGSKPIATPNQPDSRPMLAGVLCTEHALAPDTKAVVLETWLSGSAYCCTIRVSKTEAYMRWWI
jgi:hypothetical protein